MSHCRWVVIAEECYNNLVERSHPPKVQQYLPRVDVSEKETTESVQQNNTTKENTKPIPPTDKPLEKLFEPPTKLAEPREKLAEPLENLAEPRKKSAEPIEKLAESLEKLVESVENTDFSEWFAVLPASFRKDCNKLLENLLNTEGFKISNKGELVINSNPIPNYHITDFLRTVCIPYNKGQLPLQLQEWFRNHNITKFRNRLVAIRPKWVKQYSWRKSTEAQRQDR